MDEPWRPPGHTRAKVVAVVERDGRILVHRVTDSSGGEVLCPPGGGIEHGEQAVDAVRREVREELGWEIEEPELLGVVENHFHLHDTLGHEIVFAYRVSPVAPDVLDAEEPTLDENGRTVSLEWLELAEVAAGRAVLVPYALWDLLVAEAPAVRHRAVPIVRRRRDDRVEVLVVDHPHAGTQLPGGGVEHGETLADAAARELWEETGIAGAEMATELATWDRLVGVPLEPPPSRARGPVQVHRWHLVDMAVDAPMGETWTHEAHGSAAEDGLTFTCRWMVLDRRAPLAMHSAHAGAMEQLVRRLL